MNTNHEIINAVFNYDVEHLKKLLATKAFDESLLTDIRIANGNPCPIYWITQCWETVFENPEAWKDEYIGIITENKRRNLEIKQIFEDQFHVTFKPIDFYNTDFWFFRNERDDSFDDVFWGEERDEMISRGHRAIDIDLYVAVNKFDFVEVERLLKLGANPEYMIPEEGSDCMERIGAECSFLEINLQGLIIENKPIDLFDENNSNIQDFIDLIGLAAHETMYTLLSKYTAKRWQISG